MKKFYVLVALATTLFLVSCDPPEIDQAKMAYANGDYITAVNKCINGLSKKRDSQAGQQLLWAAFPKAVLFLENQISELKTASATFKDDNTVKQIKDIIEYYNQTVEMQNRIKSLGRLADKENGHVYEYTFKDYTEQIATAKTALEKGKNDAAEFHYKNGLRLAEINNLENNKSAAKEFKRALEYVPNYKDANERYENSRKAGVKKMSVISFVNSSGKTQFGDIASIIYDNLISNIQNTKEATEFLEIIVSDELKSISPDTKDNAVIEICKKLGVNEIIFGKITQLSVNPAKVVTTEYQDQLEIGNQTGPGNRIITATVAKFTSTANAKITFSYRIIEASSGKLLKTDNYTETFDYSFEWGKYRGEKNALSKSSVYLCEQTEPAAKSEEELVNATIDKLSKSLSNTMINYAK